DRVLFNRPGYSTIAFALNHDGQLRGNAFKPVFSEIRNVVINGARNVEKQIAKEFPYPQIADNYRRDYLPGIARAAKKAITAARTERDRLDKVFRNGIETEISAPKQTLLMQMLVNRKASDIIKLME